MEEAITSSQMEGAAPAVFHVPPPAEGLPKMLEALCPFANGETHKVFTHPVQRTITLHFWLAYDHPFSDGNGRTARALFYWAMLHKDYWLFEFISISSVIHKSRGQGEADSASYRQPAHLSEARGRLPLHGALPPELPWGEPPDSPQ